MVRTTETVTFNAGIPLEVNPAHVCLVCPNEMKPDTSSIINVFGREYKIRGNVETVKRALGWKSGLKVGFGAKLNDPESPQTGKVFTQQNPGGNIGANQPR